MKPRSVDQLSLFAGLPGEAGADPAPRRGAVGPAAVAEEVRELAARLPRGLYLGGSTWSFPGWGGLVYDGDYTEAKLAKEGLAAYGRHPLFRAVGLDRTFYRPIPAGDLAHYAAQVPEDFRFLVKAHEAITLPHFPDRPRYGAGRGQPNPQFLDAAYATDAVVAPFVEGLGAKAGALLFQFGPDDLGGPRFPAALHAFLGALPRGPVYAVEIRRRELLTPAYAEALAAVGACHCLNVYPRMPGILEQAERAGTARGRILVLRWLLGGGLTYEEAGQRYAPFNRLIAPDLAARQAIAGLAHRALADGQPFLATINNNAEGSAPLSAAELARMILAGPIDEAAG